MADDVKRYIRTVHTLPEFRFVVGEGKILHTRTRLEGLVARAFAVSSTRHTHV